MKHIIFLLIMFLTAMNTLADYVPAFMKYFSSGISDITYDSTNDCYCLRRRPTSKSCAYVYVGMSREPQTLEPGGVYVLARGVEATFTQHARVGYAVTFTNDLTHLDGVCLPEEFKDSNSQLLVRGSYAVSRNSFEEYAFVVNSDGLAYDVAARCSFNFGMPFHVEGDMSMTKLDGSMANIQRWFREEGVEVYNRALNELRARLNNGMIKEGGTQAFLFIWEKGGVGRISENDRANLIRNDPDADKLFRKLDANRRRETCVVFCTNCNNRLRISAVARIGVGPQCRLWTYEGKETPLFIYSNDCRKFANGYYEYGDDGLLRNVCICKNRKISEYRTVTNGVLQKLSDQHKAQAFISVVEEIFRKYVELDTTGTLLAFAEKLKSFKDQGEKDNILAK